MLYAMEFLNALLAKVSYHIFFIFINRIPAAYISIFVHIPLVLKLCLFKNDLYKQSFC